MKTINPDKLVEKLIKARDWHYATQDASYDHRAAIAILAEIIDAVRQAVEESPRQFPKTLKD